MTDRRRGMARTWVLAALTLVLPPAARAQIRRGSEIAVNQYTTSFQDYPVVTLSASGDFVVAWNTYANEDGSGRGVAARRFDAAGSALGDQFQVNTYTTGGQGGVAAAGDAAGNHVLAWVSEQDGSGTGIYARRYDPAGVPAGPSEFRVNSHTPGFQSYPRVALAADGRFLVAWSSYEDGNLTSITARVYDTDGVPTGLQVNAYTTGHQRFPSVAVDGSGNFIVAWSGAGAGDAVGVFARRYDALGGPIGGEFQVNAYTTGSQGDVAVAAAPDGTFMAVWVSVGEDGDARGVVGRRYDASGTPQGPDFVVNTFTTGNQRYPALAADGAGNFVVTWAQAGDGSAYGVFGRRYDVSGTPGPPFQVNSFITNSQGRSAVAANDNGDFVVAWQSFQQDGSYNGIFAQRFSPDLIFQDDFESGTLARWSSAMTDDGDLHPSAFAALDFSAIGLRGIVDDTSALFVADESPVNENAYRARFYFDPNGFDPGEGQNHLRTRLFIAFEESPTRRVAAVVLRRQGGVYSVMGRARLDDNSQENTTFVPISDGPHVVEIAWRRSSEAAANDGSFEMWIDGVAAGALPNLDNSVSAVDFVRLGALSVKAGASGTVFWDEFESRRDTYIGP